MSWQDEFCSCDNLRKNEWGTLLQYGLEVCGYCLKPILKEDFVTDDVIAWRKEKYGNFSTLTRSSSGSNHLSRILISSIVIAGLIVVFALTVSEIRKGRESFPQEISKPSPSVTTERPQPLGEYFGQTPIQYNFGIGCDRLRAQIYEGTAAIFREAGAMGEEDGDLELAMIAYRYADALESFDESETFEECSN